MFFLVVSWNVETASPTVCHCQNTLPRVPSSNRSAADLARSSTYRNKAYLVVQLLHHIDFIEQRIILHPFNKETKCRNYAKQIARSASF